MASEGRFNDATTIFVHAESSSFETERDRYLVCAPFSWRALVGIGPNSDKVLDGVRFVDAIVVYAAEDRESAWAVTWRVRERYPNAAVVVACDHASLEERITAHSRGAVIEGTFCFSEWLDTLLKHRVHGGHLHYVRHLLLRDQKVTPRQAQCLMLAAVPRTPYDHIAERLGVSARTVEKHLSDAALALGHTGTPAMLEHVRKEAALERHKQPFTIPTAVLVRMNVTAATSSADDESTLRSDP